MADTTRRLRREDLVRDFISTLEADAVYVVVVSYKDGNQNPRTVVGFPYSIGGIPAKEGIVIGTYLDDLSIPRPQDFEIREQMIPLSDIVGFRRFDLKEITE